jgi:hypothetical protein
MVTVLQGPERKKSVANQLIGGFGAGINAVSNIVGQKQEKEELLASEARKAKEAEASESRKYEQSLGLIEYEYNRKKEIEELKGQRKSQESEDKKNQELNEKIMPFENGLQTIGEMRNIIKGGNLGLGSEYLSILSPEARTDRAKYEQLGKSLIALSSTIPIRNQREFEVLAHNLYNPSNSDATNEGIMDAMESIIKRTVQQYMTPGQNQDRQQKPQENRPDILSFHR